MKRTGGDVPVILRGGPSDGVVMRVEKLMPELRFPIAPDFAAGVSMVEAVSSEPTPDIQVSVYVKTDDSTTLQLPFPAPPDARRIGYEYRYDRTESM